MMTCFSMTWTYAKVVDKPLTSHVLGFNKDWSRCIPNKVSGFMWKILHNKVPTKDALMRRGVMDLIKVRFWR